MDIEAMKKEIVVVLKLLATPINFEALEAEGVLKKEGAWYRVKDINNLPDYIGKQITHHKVDGKGGLLVKLPKSWKKDQQLYR